MKFLFGLLNSIVFYIKGFKVRKLIKEYRNDR
jgi:hypothetical protein